MNSPDQKLDAPLNGAAARKQELPDTTLADIRGRRHSLSDFRGSPVVLVFHTREWDPTRVHLVEAYNRIVSHVPHGGARLVSIAPDAPWHALAFAGDDTISVPILVSDAHELREHFGIDGSAAVVVLDGDGQVCWRHVAGHALPRPDLLATALATSLGDLTAGPEEVMSGGSRVWTRRAFVTSVLAAGVALMLPPLARSVTASSTLPTDDRNAGAPVAISLNVNGRTLPLSIEPRVTLLDALREHAGLNGTKKGCDHGQCGACTVHVDGRRVLSCLTLAMMVQGKPVTTIEGIGTGPSAGADGLHPMQRAFIEHDGFQCGYCTPGQIMSATAVLHEPWGPADADVKEAMSGNICRCGAYPGIVAAVQEVRKQQSAAQGATRSAAQNAAGSGA